MEDEISEALRKGDWQHAILLIDASLASDPSNPTMAYNLIISHLKLKRYKTAKELLIKYDNLISEQDKREIDAELNLQLEKKPIIKQEKKPKDESKTVLEKGEVKQFGWIQSTTTFSDVIGLEKVKRQLKEKILGPMRNPNLYKRIGAVTSSSIIIYGPPGTGKSLLARATAGEGKTKLLLATSADLISKFQGDSGKNIRLMMESARENSPVLVFIDELDSLAQKRENADGANTGPEERRILDTFLTELDGCGHDNKNIYLLGATNVPWDIDVAFRRSGRFSRSIYVPPPNTKDRAKLFEFYMGNKLKTRINYYKLALLTMGYTGADINAVCNEVASQIASGIEYDQKAEKPITTQDLAIQIHKLPPPTLFEWYSSTLDQLRKMSAEQRNQYPELQKDIVFFFKQGKPRASMYRFLANFIR